MSEKAMIDEMKAEAIRCARLPSRRSDTTAPKPVCPGSFRADSKQKRISM